MLINNILKKLPVSVQNYQSVHGGDINESYCVVSDNKKLFLKLNNAGKFPEMFEKEKDGLNALQKHYEGIVPNVIDTGITDNVQFLLMDWIENAVPQKDFCQQFGTALANMHKQPQDKFGWHTDNYIGSLVQKNTYCDTWADFYAEMRIIPLSEQLFNERNFSKTDLTKAENFCKQIANIFPEESASFLHGDLWSGNFMVAHNGYASIYDPAVYCGHREMDIGMTKLFGGFSTDFYAVYNETYPLEHGWMQRLSYTQLYPLLVHAILFGGHYIQSVKSILHPF